MSFRSFLAFRKLERSDSSQTFLLPTFPGLFLKQGSCSAAEIFGTGSGELFEQRADLAEICCCLIVRTLRSGRQDRAGCRSRNRRTGLLQGHGSRHLGISGPRGSIRKELDPRPGRMLRKTAHTGNRFPYIADNIFRRVNWSEIESTRTTASLIAPGWGEWTSSSNAFA